VEQAHWLELAANSEEKVSSRRLRESITRGRLLTVEELAAPPSEMGVSNHIPHINRLSAWWKQAGGEPWLRTRTPEQINAILRDFEPVASILNALQQRALR
jgi:hypothetical protein